MTRKPPAPHRTHKICPYPQHAGTRWLPVEDFYVARQYRRLDGTVALHRASLCRACARKKDRDRQRRTRGLTPEQVARIEHRYRQRQRARSAKTRYCVLCDNPYVSARAAAAHPSFCKACERERSRLRRYDTTGQPAQQRRLLKRPEVLAQYRAAVQGMSLAQQRALTGLGLSTISSLRAGRRESYTQYVFARIRRALDALSSGAPSGAVSPHPRKEPYAPTNR